MSDIQDQTLALASMFQSAVMINELAHGENINQAAFDCSLDSLFTLEARSVEEIYGHGEGLILGLRMLRDYLGGKQRHPDKLIAYYVLSMIKLMNKMLADDRMVAEIHEGLASILQHTDSFDMSRTSKLHQVDGLYQRTLSQIKPRIIVQGDQSWLTRSDNTSKIRTLLFAGIRAAVLWKQRGGSRLKLVFSRRKYIVQAQTLLQRVQS